MRMDDVRWVRNGGVTQAMGQRVTVHFSIFWQEVPFLPNLILAPGILRPSNSLPSYRQRFLQSCTKKYTNQTNIKHIYRKIHFKNPQILSKSLK